METETKPSTTGKVIGGIAVIGIVTALGLSSPAKVENPTPVTPAPVVETTMVRQESATQPVNTGYLPKIKIDKKTMFFIKAGTYHKFNQPLEQPAQCYHEDGTHYATEGGRSLVIYDKDLYCTGVVAQ